MGRRLWREKKGTGAWGCKVVKMQAKVKIEMEMKTLWEAGVFGFKGWMGDWGNGVKYLLYHSIWNETDD